MPSLRQLILLLLMFLPLAALYFGYQAYSWSGHAALAQELDAGLGPWGSWLVPWLDRLSPDITQGIGAYLHARNTWGWSWPAALFYGFPGALLAIPMLVGGIGWILWRVVADGFAARQTAATDEDRQAPPGADDDQPG